MSWSEKISNERVSANTFETEEIVVTDLSREINFENLGPKDVRRGKGVHFYLDVSNFHRIIADAKDDSQKQKKFIRAASVLRKIENDILNEFEVANLQLQAVRLHAFCFRPYDDENKRAEKALAAALTVSCYIEEVFNSVFSEISNFGFRTGMASGETLIANIGAAGNRELISLGTPANLAAKILGPSQSFRIAHSMWSMLPKKIQSEFSEVSFSCDEKIYDISGLTKEKRQLLLGQLGYVFDGEKWKKKTELYRDDLPLSEIELTEADVKIDIESLTERNCKRVDAVALFADLDGFTKYVQEAEDNDQIISLVRSLHMIRAEFDAFASRDFEGLVIQHRGDCMLAVAHLPGGKLFKENRCQEGLEITLGLQSSMEHVLQKHLGHRTNIHVAIGADSGACILSRLGKKGDREVVCFGASVDVAESLQRKTQGQNILISEEVYSSLPKSVLKDQFSTIDKKEYLLKNMTFPRLTELEIKNSVEKGTSKISSANGVFIVDKGSEAEAKKHLKSNPWNRSDR